MHEIVLVVARHAHLAFVVATEVGVVDERNFVVRYLRENLTAFSDRQPVT
jgi:hypothetical protein